jgi:hypothetical protein
VYAPDRAADAQAIRSERGRKTRQSFWPLASNFLSGTAAAAIAAINSLDNLGGLIGPNLVGWLKDST